MILGPRPGESEEEWEDRCSGYFTWQSNMNALANFLDDHHGCVPSTGPAVDCYWELMRQSTLITPDQLENFGLLLQTQESRVE